MKFVLDFYVIAKQCQVQAPTITSFAELDAMIQTL